MGFTVQHENAYTGGWNATFERVLFCDGEFDPWRSATLSSRFRPGGPRTVSDDDGTPVFVMKGGVHTPDMVIKDEEDWVEVAVEEVKIMKKWLGEWKP
jgi:hypothetical protein